VRAFEKEGFESAQLDESGLVRKREDGPGWFDLFRNRLMFPIHDQSGRIIAFGGRALAAEQTPKYLNSPGTKIYEKRKVLYNLHRAKQGIRKSDRVVLVEGYMDVIGVWSAGIQEVVAPCGTALVSEQVRMLKGHTERVVVNFDPDEAGASATEKKLQTLLEEGMRIRVLHLQDGLDPDEFVKEHGAERYRECLEKAPGYFHWLADRARARFDMRSTEGRIEALKFLLPAVQRVTDRLERATAANDLAQYLGIDAGLILDHFKKAAAERREKPLTITAGVKPIESILINAFVASEEARAELLPIVRGLPTAEEFATRRILQALYAMADSGTAFSFGELEARLDDQGRELLHKLVFSDTEAQEPDKLCERAAESVRALQQAGHEARRAELKARARDAERAGNIAEALRITRQLDALDRETNAHAQGRE
jgi:DNA primase